MQRFNLLFNQPELSAIHARTLETQAAQKVWGRIAPENLMPFSHASSLKNGQLKLCAYNNAVAAKIKLLIPSLLINLEKQGHEVTAIQVKVQVKSTLVAKPKHQKKLTPGAARNLKQLAEKLAGTTLGDALARLSDKT